MKLNQFQKANPIVKKIFDLSEMVDKINNGDISISVDGGSLDESVLGHGSMVAIRKAIINVIKTDIELIFNELEKI